MGNSACSLTRTDDESDVRNLCDECAWLYAFCREYLFRDQTEEIMQAIFPYGVVSKHASILEVGCGPGFYSRRFAQRFPTLRIIGIDRSARLVSWAQRRASANNLANCVFLKGDVECLSDYVQAVDAVISSRLLLVVANRPTVLAEMFRVLKPGGRLFLAEPTATFKTQLPLSAMQLITRLIPSSRRHKVPQNAVILPSLEFEDLVRSQPWSRVSIQMFDDYQCAICEKSPHWQHEMRLSN